MIAVSIENIFYLLSVTNKLVSGLGIGKMPKEHIWPLERPVIDLVLSDISK